MSNQILIVDDASFMRLMLKDILEGAGFKDILEAETSSLALSLVESNKPAVVLLDITMPDIDGIDVLDKIKTVSPETSVIMCSSMGLGEVVETCFEHGADDFITKPFKAERIIQAVSKFI